jgi:hypothetical protein
MWNTECDDMKFMPLKEQSYQFQYQLISYHIERSKVTSSHQNMQTEQDT